MNMNRKYYYLLFLLILIPINVFAEVVGEKFCTDTAAAMRFVGFIIFALKILVPFIIIIIGTFDFYGAVTGSKGDELKKSATTLGRRIITGIIIFFIPTIIELLFNVINDSVADTKSDYDVCANCLLKPFECEVKDN